MASEDDLRAWFTASGLKNKKLEGALRASEAAGVEDVGDLRMMLGTGDLEGVFSGATLSYIKAALKAPGGAGAQPEPEDEAELATTHRLTDHDCSSEGLLSPLGGFVLLKLLARPRCATCLPTGTSHIHHSFLARTQLARDQHTGASMSVGATRVGDRLVRARKSASISFGTTRGWRRGLLPPSLPLPPPLRRRRRR